MSVLRCCILATALALAIPAGAQPAAPQPAQPSAPAKPAKPAPPKKPAAAKPDPAKKSAAKKPAAREKSAAKPPPKVYRTGPRELRDKDGNVIPTSPDAYNVDSAMPAKPRK